MGVVAVLVAGHLIGFAGWQEVERYAEVAFTLFAVGDACHIPLIAFALSHDEIFAHLGADGAGFVPGYRHAGDEAGEIVGLQIARG